MTRIHKIVWTDIHINIYYGEFLCNRLRWEVVVCFVYNGGIVDHHCLNYLLLKYVSTIYSDRLVVLLVNKTTNKWWISNYIEWCIYIIHVHTLICQLKYHKVPSWSWSYDSCIYNYTCNQYLLQLTL